MPAAGQLLDDDDDALLWSDLKATLRSAVKAESRQETMKSRRAYTSTPSQKDAANHPRGKLQRSVLVPSAPQRPSTAPAAPKPKPKKQSNTNLRRISFIPVTDPESLTKYPLSPTPQNGRFTPTGGFYVDEKLEYEFSMKKSEARSLDLMAGSLAGRSSPTAGYHRMKIRRQHQNDDDDDNEHTPAHSQAGSSAAEGEWDAECSVTLWIAIGERDNPNSFRSALRQYSHQLPDQGTKLVVTMRRLWINDDVHDVTMTFPFAKVKHSKSFHATFYSIVRTSIIVENAKRRGKWIICQANEDLEQYLYQYCSQRLAEENPCDAVHAAVFISHRKLYEDPEAVEATPAVSTLLRVSSQDSQQMSAARSKLAPFGERENEEPEPPAGLHAKYDDTSSCSSGSSDGGLLHRRRRKSAQKAKSFFGLTMSLVRRARQAQEKAASSTPRHGRPPVAATHRRQSRDAADDNEISAFHSE